MARHFVRELRRRPDWSLAGVPTRRALDRADGNADGCPTQSPDALLETADIVFAWPGDVRYTARLAGRVLDAGRQLVTLDAAFHVAPGSACVGRSCLTEAEGEQPGTTAWLARAARQIGFRARVCGNREGFSNPTPTPDEMRSRAERQGIGLPMVTAFTDDSELQVELVRVLRGGVLDVVVVLRRGSSSFDRHVAVELGFENRLQHLVPKGFAHGFLTVEPDSEVLYKVDAAYAPAAERGLHCADPDLAVARPDPPGVRHVSAEDRAPPLLRELSSC